MNIKIINLAKQLKFFIFVLLISTCGGEENIEVENLPSSTTTTKVVVETTTSTTILDYLEVENCVSDDNTNLNLEKNIEAQKFLNRYGFNAGEEDGYFGNQSIEALRKFQAYAGLKPDGDLGPITISVMKSWTGCEEEAGSYTPPPTTTANSSEVQDTSSTTLPTTTTTTVIPVNNSNEVYGYIPAVGIDTNNPISIFKGVSDPSSICGTPYYNNLTNNAKGYFSNGIISESSILPSIYSQSSNTARISSNTNDQVEIEIIGNGDDGFNFYFISPFSSQTTQIVPEKISVSSGKTVATFNKNNLKTGYWFFSFAENYSGQIIKSSSPREFNNGTVSSQTYSGSVEVEILSFTKNNKNVGSGEALSTSDEIAISYITKGSYDAKPATTNDIQVDDNVISLINDDQAEVGDLLIINNEVMKVLSKESNNYTVQRGFNNTEPKKHLSNASVKKIKNPENFRVNSNYAYLILRTETGKRFQLRLNNEVQSHEFTLDGCPNDRYLFEEIKTFSWREQGKSIVASNSIKNSTGVIFNKSFVVNQADNIYISPKLNSINVETGSFANTGPKNINISSGSQVIFSFSGLEKGSSNLKFIEIKFQMLPTSGSSKSSTNRSVFFPINDSKEFIININSVTSSTAYRFTDWESGYRYILTELSVFDEVSKMTFKNNGQIIYDDSNITGSHDVYYLDQFSFNIP
jgi:peptidoglycan hydrolase-like protein with peptidoglycan-binding domain